MVLYLSEHPALCMLEIVVNLSVDPKYLPVDYVLMTVIVPDNLATETTPTSLERGKEYLFGDLWLRERRSPVLWVPSVVMPQSYNILVNPEHPQSGLVTTKSVDSMVFDPRLFR